MKKKMGDQCRHVAMEALKLHAPDALIVDHEMAGRHYDLAQARVIPDFELENYRGKFVLDSKGKHHWISMNGHFATGCDTAALEDYRKYGNAHVLYVQLYGTTSKQPEVAEDICCIGVFGAPVETHFDQTKSFEWRGAGGKPTRCVYRAFMYQLPTPGLFPVVRSFWPRKLSKAEQEGQMNLLTSR